MQNIMYEIPSDPAIQSVLVTKACVTDHAPPQIVRNPNKLRDGLRRSGASA